MSSFHMAAGQGQWRGIELADAQRLYGNSSSSDIYDGIDRSNLVEVDFFKG